MRHEDRGFRQIGSLTTPIENLRVISDSTPTTQSSSSAIIGQESQAREGLRLAGPERGVIAAEKLPSVREAFAANNPALVDKSLWASLPRSVTSALEPVTVDISTERYGYEVELVSFNVGDAPAEDLKRALWMVEKTLRPAPKVVVQSELARLKVTTKSRAENGEDLSLMLAAYAEYLEEYPADVMVDAMRAWARNEKWWPAWSELKESLDWRVKKRRALQAGLGRAAGRS